MRSYLSILALVGIVAAVDPTAGFNVITFPSQNSVLTVGQTVDITWEPNSQFPGSSKLVLLAGNSPATLSPVATLAPSLDNSLGTFPWTVNGNTDMPVFGLEFIAIDNDNLIQFSFPFGIKAADGGNGDSGKTATGSTSQTSTTGATSETSTGAISETSATVTTHETSATVTVTATTTTTPTASDDWASVPTESEPPSNTQFQLSQSASPTWSTADCKTTGFGSAGQNGTSSGSVSGSGSGSGSGIPECDCEGSDGDSSIGSSGVNDEGSSGSSSSDVNNNNNNSGWESNTQGAWSNGTSTWQTIPAATQTFVDSAATGALSAETSIVTGAASKAVAGGFAMFGGAALAILAL